MNTTIGIDPGLQGGLAALRRGGGSYGVRMPILNGRVNVEAFLKALPPTRDVELVVMESLGFRRQQSVQSAKTQSINWGMMLGALHAHGYGPIIEVIPQTWKKVILAGTEKDKDASIAYVENHHPDIDLIPRRCKKPHDGISDAVCIAAWGRIVMKGAS